MRMRRWRGAAGYTITKSAHKKAHNWVYAYHTGMNGAHVFAVPLRRHAHPPAATRQALRESNELTEKTCLRSLHRNNTHRQKQRATARTGERKIVLSPSRRAAGGRNCCLLGRHKRWNAERSRMGPRAASAAGLLLWYAVHTSCCSSLLNETLSCRYRCCCCHCCCRHRRRGLLPLPLPRLWRQRSCRRRRPAAT